MLWIDYFRELDTTRWQNWKHFATLWIDYFRELDTTIYVYKFCNVRCGLITLGN